MIFAYPVALTARIVFVLDVIHHQFVRSITERGASNDSCDPRLHSPMSQNNTCVMLELHCTNVANCFFFLSAATKADTNSSFSLNIINHAKSYPEVNNIKNP